MMNGNNILNIDSLKHAIDVTYVDDQNQTVSCKAVPQQVINVPIPPGLPPVYAMGVVMYDTTNRRSITIPIPAIKEFGPPFGEMTEKEKLVRPDDPVTYAKVMLFFALPAPAYADIARSLTKELHWAQKKLEFFRKLGYAGYSALEAEFDEVWQNLEDESEEDGPPMTEEQVWDAAVEKMMKEG